MLTPAQPLETVAGKSYVITFFHDSQVINSTAESYYLVDVMWNGDVIATITPGFSPWKLYQFTATAVGNDVLAFRGGRESAWSLIDDISVFLE